MELQRQVWEIEALEQLCSVQESLIKGRFKTTRDFYSAMLDLSAGILASHGTVFGSLRLEEIRRLPPKSQVN
jgi:hypothetical protein